MVQKVLHWIYCLPLESAALMGLLATALFFWLRRRYESKRWWKPMVLVLLACWAVGMGMTTLAREHARYLPSLIPFQTYVTVFSGGERELIRSAFMNVLLYYPGGLLALSLLPPKKRGLALLAFCLLSVSVEAGQYLLSVGVAETDDVFHNTLGVALSWLALHQYEKHNTGA